MIAATPPSCICWIGRTIALSRHLDEATEATTNRPHMSFTANHGRSLLPATVGFVLCLLSSVAALAQVDSGNQASQPSPAPRSLPDRPLRIEQQFLRVESSPWSPLGLRLSKNGRQSLHYTFDLASAPRDCNGERIDLGADPDGHARKQVEPRKSAIARRTNALARPWWLT